MSEQCKMIYTDLVLSPIENSTNNSNNDFNYEVLQRITAIETNINIILEERPKIQEEIAKLELKELEAQTDIKQINNQMAQLKTLIIKFACYCCKL